MYVDGNLLMTLVKKGRYSVHCSADKEIHTYTRSIIHHVSGSNKKPTVILLLVELSLRSGKSK